MIVDINHARRIVRDLSKSGISGDVTLVDEARRYIAEYLQWRAR